VSRVSLVLLACVIVGLAPAAASTAPAPLPSHPLNMGIIGATETYGPEANTAFARIRSAGMSLVLTSINWSLVAPASAPTSWNPTDPGDSHYDWSAVDPQVKALISHGLQPILVVADAPAWARLAPAYQVSAPEPGALGQFMRAAAERYSGRYNGLPRVRYWQIWNEPNIGYYFVPQIDSSNAFVSPGLYRDMVNAAAQSIHGVARDNVVIAGSTSPFRDTSLQWLDPDWGPLKFMRHFLCVDDSGKPSCNDTVSFDAWGTHPYTSGGPTHHAALPYDVSLGDLPKMAATLRAGEAAGHIKSSRKVQFWANEFSWDSTPPDKCSPPLSLLKRWVPEAFYRMWASGVDMIAWFVLMDYDPAANFYQSGLYFHSAKLASAKPKPFIEAFRLPFVALRRGSRVYVWAHTPFGKRGVVAVQQLAGRRWKQVKRLRADRYGITQAVLTAKPIGQFRAAFGREKSLPFSMKVPPDQFFNPFGQATLLEPDGQTSCTP
jgi:hypothetical protein